jgi:hypothetical protein
MMQAACLLNPIGAGVNDSEFRAQLARECQLLVKTLNELEAYEYALLLFAFQKPFCHVNLVQA